MSEVETMSTGHTGGSSSSKSSLIDPGDSSSSIAAANTASGPIVPQSHHIQQELCYSRAPYRQGREFKAVKVYTINEESKHMLLQNIPKIGLEAELKKLCQQYGTIMEFRPVPESEYPPKSAFTTVFYVKYESLRHAKYAKTKLDNRAFYGELIHICYAPELECIEDVREKLRQRAVFVESYHNRSRKRKRNND